MKDHRADLERMWFRCQWDPDQKRYRYYAGDDEVDHREWHARQYTYWTKGD